MNLTRIVNARARKTAFKRRMQRLKKEAKVLTTSGGLDVCMTFFNRNDNKLVVWPSEEVVESLIDRFSSLPIFERNNMAETQESFNINTNIQEIQKKLVDCRKRVAELKMNHLISQLENGRGLDDLSQTEIESLRSYTDKKITGLNKKLGYQEHAYTSVNKPFLKDETPKVLDGPSARQGHCSSMMGSESMYLLDKWFLDDPKIQEHGDGTHVITKTHGFDLNLEPSDDEEDMSTVTG
ncbi:unnamed protein product [Eruca vesicaria subsp. sativa]|uniref:MADS-box domain-containing protein n=1 Tax=Eruca vesicaria subsp. sativa TaxID=29727 RepID=A0ABC8JD66_ERUVS|nr:unnamed protein product [Eruca vesicaria subsp. sativa]